MLSNTVVPIRFQHWLHFLTSTPMNPRLGFNVPTKQHWIYIIKLTLETGLDWENTFPNTYPT